MKNFKILIVDDEKELREGIKTFFEIEDFTCLTAKNGEDALSLLENEDVHLVLSDIRMPKCTGIDLLKRIKEKDKFLPEVILMTGFAEVTKEEALGLGASELLLKPLDMRDLIGRISNTYAPKLGVAP
ncbi:MAG: two-component system response regulator [Halobacteriovoraceae bacterium]|nr:two-component system response regulator [Halobacteriovoraceae bacterium]|tara:strand:- start:258947 stop:259330 length:384 start_codon:yes stop_codon:yes gene_type:complete